MATTNDGRPVTAGPAQPVYIANAASDPGQVSGGGGGGGATTISGPLGRQADAASISSALSTEDVALLNSIITKLPGRSTSAAKSNVAGAIASTTILASNANRLGATILNDSAALLYLDLSGGTASSTSYTVQLAPNAYYEVPFGYTGAITGIWTSATGNARVTEFT